MTQVYLIDISDFTRRADLTQNLNTDRLKGEIGVTQEKYGIKILCKDLYNEIISQYPDSLSPENEALLPFIQDFLVYKTYERYTQTANLLSTPSGFRTQTDPTSTVATDEQMRALIRKTTGDANFYQDQLINFLICNEDNYPLWKNSICNCAPNRRPVNGNEFSKVGRKKSFTRIAWT